MIEDFKRVMAAFGADQKNLLVQVVDALAGLQGHGREFAFSVYYRVV
ncbi:hypothetical protein [Pseudomonas inefficax]